MLTQVLQNGHHQAVRIPVDFHFDVDTIEILNLMIILSVP